MSAVPSHLNLATGASAARVYRRRRPERTALYRLVQQHLETWLARARESDPDGSPFPRHVEQELRGFLECGILAFGFARAHCDACGHVFLVAFSCKGRGICPSCTTRRMAETAAHLVEHVFPRVPVRQWVVTFPKRLRFFLHRDPALLGRVRRSVLRTIETEVRRRCPGAPSGSRCGAVSFVQRFGSALNAHTHLHCCVTDGVFALDAEGALRCYPAADLESYAVGAVQRRLRTRVLRTAVRHGALTPAVAADLARWGHGGGFSVHAAVRIEA
ncbi:MAG TPA: transposase zinc-binding domain-containing protein, partial [Steroidobacteraceae bacterium]